MQSIYLEIMKYGVLVCTVLAMYFSFQVAKRDARLKALRLSGFGFAAFILSYTMTKVVQYYSSRGSKNAAEELGKIMEVLDGVVGDLTLAIQTLGFVLIAFSMYKLSRDV